MFHMSFVDLHAADLSYVQPVTELHCRENDPEIVGMIYLLNPMPGLRIVADIGQVNP
jgi:hypothetical protein